MSNLATGILANVLSSLTYLLLLLLSAASRIFSRDVVLHLLHVADLVLFGLLLPLANLFVGEFLVLASQDARLE